MERRLVILQSKVAYQYMNYRPYGNLSYYEEKELNGHFDAYINLSQTPIEIGGNLL